MYLIQKVWCALVGKVVLVLGVWDSEGGCPVVNRYTSPYGVRL